MPVEPVISIADAGRLFGGGAFLSACASHLPALFPLFNLPIAVSFGIGGKGSDEYSLTLTMVHMYHDNDINDADDNSILVLAMFIVNGSKKPQ
jgi:hypothetical protein